MAGPAYPLFRSSLHFSLSPSLIGPACHCGRSRLFFPPFYLPHPPRPFISLSSIGPACHCGRSRQFLISPLLSKFFPPPLPPFFPRFRVWGLGRGGIAIDWVTQRWRFWQMHLRLMYSQATVRSYTKDRAVLRWDHTLKRGRV